MPTGDGSSIHWSPSRDHQRKALPLGNWISTVHHGLPDDLYRVAAEPDDGYLAFLGRISPEKRPDRAIAIAKRLGLKLKIAAKVDPVDNAYFAEIIAPLLVDALRGVCRRDQRR